MKLQKIAEQFDIVGEATRVEPCGQGHINSTYLVSTDSKYGFFNYILQKVNTDIFQDIDGLMNNIFAVTEYISKKVAGGQENCRTLNFVRARSGDKYYRDSNGDVYRMYVYLSNVASIQIAENTQHLYLAGKGFGQFQRLLNGFKAESLSDTIKDFHNTPKRYKDFVEAVNCDAVGRLSMCREEVDFYLSRQSYASRVTDLLASGKIPLRVTHNDTKINNVLIDIFDNYPVAVIDLDTVMSGSILYDFGDSIRSGTNIGAEDEVDLDKVGFSIDLFSAYAKGFMSEVSEILTSAEVDNLAFSGILLTYECGMRFLGDYLNGDKYFKTHREGHNLDRARTQIKMISDMEQQLPDMEKIIKSVL